MEEKKTNQKTVEEPTPTLKSEDPYGGTLAKTNFLLFAFIVVSVLSILIGAIWISIFSFNCINNDTNFVFEKIQLPTIFLALGFVVLIASCIFKSIVEKKRNSAYSSKHEKIQITGHKPSKVSTEKAKQGQATSETTLSVSNTKEGFKFCPHCKAKIPESSGLVCPKCGKRMDIEPTNKN